MTGIGEVRVATGANHVVGVECPRPLNEDVGLAMLIERLRNFLLGQLKDHIDELAHAQLYTDIPPMEE